MSMPDGSQTQAVLSTTGVTKDTLEELAQTILDQKLNTWRQGVSEEIAAVGKNVTDNGAALDSLGASLTGVQTGLDTALQGQVTLRAEMRLQGLLLGAALLLVVLISAVTWFLQRLQIKRAYQDISTMQDDLMEMGAQLLQRQDAARQHAAYAARAAGSRGQLGAGQYPPYAPYDPPAPPPPPVDPVQEIRTHLNSVLRNPEYTGKVPRLVLENVDHLTGLRPFDPEGTYFGDGSGGVALVPSQREAVYFGYIQNGLLYVFPNYSIIDISQAPDRIFEGYRLHVAIEAVQRPAVFAPDNNDRWILQQRGQLA